MPEHHKRFLSQGASAAQIPVRMRGILEIQSSTWASEDGLKALLRILRKRDVSARKAARGGSVEESNLEFHHIFDPRTGKPRDQGITFKVIIQAKKAGPAVYLTCK